MMIYSKANQKSIDNAVAKARQIKPRVRITGFGQFEVQGSQPYMVTFKKLDGEFAAECGCKANENGNVCYHVAAVSAVFKKQVADRAAEKAATAPRQFQVHIQDGIAWVKAFSQDDAEMLTAEQSAEIIEHEQPAEIWLHQVSTDYHFHLLRTANGHYGDQGAVKDGLQNWIKPIYQHLTWAAGGVALNQIQFQAEEQQTVRIYNPALEALPEGPECLCGRDAFAYHEGKWTCGECLKNRQERWAHWDEVEAAEALNPEPEHTRYEESIASANYSQMEAATEAPAPVEEKFTCFKRGCTVEVDERDLFCDDHALELSMIRSELFGD
jgi:hypothetical protein